MALRLEEFAEAIEEADDQTRAYYSPREDEIVYFDEEAGENPSMDDEEGDLVELPGRRERDEYGMMQDFAQSRNEQEKSWLLNALRGAGAFHRFRAVLERFGITGEWYSWRDQALRQLAMEWCEENGIPYSLSQAEEKEAVEEPVMKKTAASWRVVPVNSRNVMRCVNLAAASLQTPLDYEAGQALLEEALQQGCHLYAASRQGVYGGLLIVDPLGRVTDIFVQEELRRQHAAREMLAMAEKELGPLVIVLPAEKENMRDIFACLGYGKLLSLQLGKEK
jgi:hypothetical protein